MYLQSTIDADYYPLVDEYIAGLVSQVEEKEEKEMLTITLKAHTMSVLEGGHDYFYRNLMEGDVGANIELFGAVRFANPSPVKQLAQVGV